jgi:hypothetical protein
MSNKFVEIPRDQFVSVMEGAGFQPLKDGGELAFRRFHGCDPDLQVLVLTSVPWNGDEVRAVGEDAVRVMALAKTSSGANRKLWGCRVNRVGTVGGALARVLERARDAYDVLNKAINDRVAKDPEYAKLTKAWRSSRGVAVTKDGVEVRLPRSNAEAAAGLRDYLLGVAKKHHGDFQ